MGQPKHLQLTYHTLSNKSKKYWKQRYSLFSKFDEGILMNQELWFSVTGERVAIFIAKLLRAYYQDGFQDSVAAVDQDQVDLEYDPAAAAAAAAGGTEQTQQGECDGEQGDNNIQQNIAGITILDVFCGGGGNTIQFARRFDRVFALDFNSENIYCTKNNCGVYGVADHVECVEGDWTDEGVRSWFKSAATAAGAGQEDDDDIEDDRAPVDVIFASPPWGGPGYKNTDVFDLDYLLPLPLKELLETFFIITNDVCLFLPRNSDVKQLSDVTKELLGPEARCRVVYAYDNGFLKGMFVLFGRFV